MKIKFLIFTLLAVLGVTQAQADTLELADGDLIEGELVGLSNGMILWNTGAGIEAYAESDVVGIYNSEGVAAREAETQAAPAQPTTVTVPSGTRMMIRIVESIDSKRHPVGHRFRSQLDGAIQVGGQTVIPRGTMLYGRITSASGSGRLAGSADLAIEFTDIMIDDVIYEIATTGLKAQGSNEAGRTVGRTARAAAIGGLIDGSSGARTGAKVGAGASLLTSGSSINIPAGTLVETQLRVPLTIPN